MNRSADRNPGFDAQTTAQAQTFRRVGLHIEIADGVDLWLSLKAVGPGKNRLLLAVKQVAIDPIITPGPKLTINPVVMPKKFSADDIGLVDLFGKRLVLLPVLRRQHTNFELFPL
jgi:hypothetical protein